MVKAPQRLSPGKRRRERTRLLYSPLFLLPWAFFFLVFKVYPFVYGFVISFTNYTLRGSTFQGLANYKELLTDEKVWISIRTTLICGLISVPGIVVLSLSLARAIHPRSAAVQTAAKSILYLPSLICSVVIVVIVNYLFSTAVGFLPWVCEKLGIPVFSVFDTPALSIPLMSILVVLLGVGQPVILYTAAMNGISQDLYDAAAIDGAAKGQIFRRITLPLLKPTTTLILITSTINALQMFVYPMLFTGGGPYYATSTMMLLLYNSAFTAGRFGYSAAIGVVLFALTSVIAVIQFRLTSQDVEA